jgi:acyl dehydratase
MEQHGTEATATYRVRAFNTATASANKIHDDDVARNLGFRGGLVPGVDVFAYLCHLPVERWGADWLQRGTITARFVAPVYDGDEVDVQAATGDGGALALTLTDPAGADCAVGTAALPVAAPTVTSIDDWPGGPVPEDPPPASAASLTSGPFGMLEVGFHSLPALSYLDDVREEHPLFRVDGLAHPGWLLRYANYVLSSNVRLGPWIHVESTVQLLGLVRDGDRLETRANVLGVRERGGHHLVDLDVLQLVGDRPVARTTHTAIYQPRGVTT